MTKTYTTPSIEICMLKAEQMICLSRMAGVESTGDLSTILSVDDETDEYLSRSREVSEGWDEDGLW